MLSAAENEADDILRRVEICFMESVEGVADVGGREFGDGIP